jgi:hypothetical protein
MLYLAIRHFTKDIRKFVTLKCSVSVDPRSQTESAELPPEWINFLQSTVYYRSVTRTNKVIYNILRHAL